MAEKVNVERVGEEKVLTTADKRKAVRGAEESQRAHYEEVADKINNEDGLLQK